VDLTFATAQLGQFAKFERKSNAAFGSQLMRTVLVIDRTVV